MAKKQKEMPAPDKDVIANRSTKIAYIKWAFINPDSPACFTSASAVRKFVKKKYPETSLAEVEDVLQREPAYTLHKARRIHYRRLKTRASGFMSDVQVDLADTQKIATENHGYRYILVGVDVLSRRLFAAPVKSKESKDMIQAFQELFKQMPSLPQRIFSDKGVEFQAKEMKKFFKENHIEKIIGNDPDVKASVAERFIRTLKGRLNKRFSSEENSTWVDVLPKVVKAINNSENSATGIRPVDVNFKNAEHLCKQLYGEPGDFYKQDTKYEKGDKVRIAKWKKTFEKSYLPNYTTEVFEVAKATSSQKRPDHYEIKDLKGEKILGKYYNEELSKTKYQGERRLIIEKVLKQRWVKGVHQIFCKWQGQPLSSATWVNSSDVLGEPQRPKKTETKKKKK